MTTPLHPAARPYRPDGGFDARGVVMLTCALIVAGGALGFVAHFISQWFYLIFLFPLAIGLGVGFVGAQVAELARVRNPWIGLIGGLGAGIFAMAMMHYFDYRTFREQQAAVIADFDPAAIASIRSTSGPVPLADQEEALPEGVAPALRGVKTNEQIQKEKAFQSLVDAIRVTSFAGYMDYEARQGVELKRASGGSDKSGLNLGYVGSYLYWIVETLIVAGVATFALRAQVAMPFCRSCDAWRQERLLGGFTGDGALAADGVRDGDLKKLAAAGPVAGAAEHLLHVARCANCAADAPEADVRLVRVTTDAKGNPQQSTVAHVTWPQSLADQAAALFAAPTTAPAETATA